jgi:Uncharacterized protein conserved in bacteria (DUF2325)
MTYHYYQENRKRRFPMRIGWVGGLSRSETYLVKIAADAGHELEYHNGNVKGRGAGELASLVDRSSFLIILITVNSHQGVRLAKQMARKRKRPAIVLQRCGQLAFRKVLAAIDKGADQIEAKDAVYGEIWEV